MKRIISFFLTLVMAFSMFTNIANAEVSVAETDKQYEFWTMAPYLTTNIGNEEFRIFKAMELDKLHMYPVEAFGDRYYFAIAEAQFSNSGVNGRSKLSELYCYLLLTTDDGFIIIDSCCCWSSYSWDAGVNIEDISDKVTTPSKGSKVRYMITPNGKYSTTDWDDYNDYIFLTDDKRMTLISENNSVRQGGWPVVKNGKMYWGKDYQSNGKKYTIDYIDAMLLTEMSFSSGKVEYGSAGKVLLSEVIEANGYTVYKTLQPEVQKISVYKIPESDGLYFQMANSPVYNEAGTIVSYDDEFEIFKCDNGKFSSIKTLTFPSGYNYQTGYTVTQFGNVDASKYTSQGLSIPVLDISKRYIVTSTGQIVRINLDTTIYKNWNYALYNGKLVVIRSQNGSQYIYDGGYMQALNYLTVDSRGVINLSDDIILPQIYAPNDGQNGYYSGGSSFTACTTFTKASFSPAKEWWGRFQDNVFDDGRAVYCDWNYVGNYYEMWYTITYPDGTVCAKGPTGYIRDSSKAEKEFFCVAIGNSKFVAGLLEVNGTNNKELYRASVVKETGDGNVVSSVSLGNKTLTPPANTDTVPVQSIINFGEDNLPIGYNIKDNVVGTNKLDSSVRERINAIRLNDIVIVKNTETASGTQNTGISLDGYEMYDTELGDSAIRVYTNGQNFCWYVGEVSDLNTGTYNRNYTIGDKVIYVTYKIVEAPGNTGVTTVVF